MLPRQAHHTAALDLTCNSVHSELQNKTPQRPKTEAGLNSHPVVTLHLVRERGGACVVQPHNAIRVGSGSVGQMHQVSGHTGRSVVRRERRFEGVTTGEHERVQPLPCAPGSKSSSCQSGGQAPLDSAVHNSGVNPRTPVNVKTASRAALRAGVLAPPSNLTRLVSRIMGDNLPSLPRRRLVWSGLRSETPTLPERGGGNQLRDSWSSGMLSNRHMHRHKPASWHHQTSQLLQVATSLGGMSLGPLSNQVDWFQERSVFRCFWVFWVFGFWFFEVAGVMGFGVDDRLEGHKGDQGGGMKRPKLNVGETGQNFQNPKRKKKTKRTSLVTRLCVFPSVKTQVQSLHGERVGLPQDSPHHTLRTTSTSPEAASPRTRLCHNNQFD